MSGARVPVEVQRPGLLAFWDFHEAPGEARVSGAGEAYRLRECGGPILRVNEGPFGSAARIATGQYFLLPREELGALDIHGPKAEVSVVAWVKRLGAANWQAVAGVWDESVDTRQYCLFLNAYSETSCRTMQRTPCANRVHAHISSVGGPTPGAPFCLTYATGASEVLPGRWACLAFTYDAKEIRVYVDGRLDAQFETNPFPYAEGIFDGGPAGAPLSVGANSVRGQMENFFDGLFGGLAIFGRALQPDEVAGLSAARRQG